MKSVDWSPAGRRRVGRWRRKSVKSAKSVDSSPAGRRRGRRALPDRDPSQAYPPDTGCALWQRCLTCPLPRCIEDDLPDDTHAERVEARNEAIYHAWQAQPDKNIPVLAREFNVSRRTVHRVVAAALPPAPGSRRLSLSNQQRSPCGTAALGCAGIGDVA